MTYEGFVKGVSQLKNVEDNADLRKETSKVLSHLILSTAPFCLDLGTLSFIAFGNQPMTILISLIVFLLFLGLVNIVLSLASADIVIYNRIKGVFRFWILFLIIGVALGVASLIMLV